MPLRIATNLASINGQRSLEKSQRKIDLSFAQLSSGSRITKAADDAAGLTISENLKSRIGGYKQAKRNTADAVSLMQVAEGGLNEIGNILVRMRELGVQAATDTLGTVERDFINKEVEQLKLEIDRISQTTRWGKKELLNGSGGEFAFQIDLGNDDFEDRISFQADDVKADTGTLGVADFDFSGEDGGIKARESLTKIEDAQVTINKYRSNIGALQNRLFSTEETLSVAIENLSAANSRIRDTDIADSTAELTKSNILLQASTSVLAQANQAPSVALGLIG